MFALYNIVIKKKKIVAQMPLNFSPVARETLMSYFETASSEFANVALM